MRSIKDFLFLIKRLVRFDKWFAGRQQSDLPTPTADWDKKLVYSLGKHRIPSLAQLKYVGRFLTQKERKVVNICSLLILLSLVGLSVNFYYNHLTDVPQSGGAYTEALIGSPKRINPLYANINDVDSDLASLLFSSILKRNGQGELENDLATEVSVSSDGKEYLVRLRHDAKWHNGEQLDADDIVFTIEAIKDRLYKSTLRTSYMGVKAEKLDDFTVKFILDEPYAGFSQLLTFQILPKFQWETISPESASLVDANLNPLGSGPYRFKSYIKDKDSGRISVVNLTANTDYYGSKANIKDLSFVFSPNFEEAINAFNNNSVDGIAYLPKDFRKNLASPNSIDFHNLKIPQITAVFYNAKANPNLADVSVRQALSSAVDKQAIKDEVLGGTAELIDGPILPGNFAYNPGQKRYAYSAADANALLEKSGWKATAVTEDQIKEAMAQANDPDEAKKEAANQLLGLGAGNWRSKDGKYLKVRLTVVDNNESISIATLVKKNWEAAGIKTEVEAVPSAAVQFDIIKPRNFEALLFGQVVGFDPDMYAFWHSSQASENNLNIANYSNKEADQLLEDARATTTLAVRVEKYQRFQEVLANDAPATFLFSPVYTYVQSKKVKNNVSAQILLPRDRFAGISGWYVKTAKKISW